MLLNELDQNILLKIIESDEPVSSTYLSVVCHVAINTIRKEIDIINDYLVDKGCRIRTKQAVGYEFIIENETLAIPFIEQFSVEMNRYGYLNISENQDHFFIARHLLMSEHNINVDSIANKLYISKSTILRLIKKIREYLGRFDLDVKVKRNSGLYVDGTEFAKRLCLINMHKIYIHTPDKEMSTDPLFKATFMTDTDVDISIRRSIYKMLRRYKYIAISAIDIPKILNYIVLTKTRSKYRKDLIFDKMQLDELEKFSFEPIDYLINDLPIIFKEEFKEIDKLGLKAIIYSFNQLPLGDIYASKAFDISQDCFEHVIKRYPGIKGTIDDKLISDFASFIQQIYYRHLFKIKTDEEAFLLTNKRGILASDISAYITDYLNQSNINLSQNDRAKAYMLIYRAIHTNFRGPYRKLKLLCISRYGHYYADVIKARLLRMYGNVINKIDIAESSILFEPDKITIYDAIVTDLGINVPIYSNIANKPYIYIGFNRTKDDFKHFEQYLRELSLSDVKEIFKEDHFIVIDDAKVNDILKIVYDKGAFDCTFNEFADDIKKRREYADFKRNNSIALVTNLNIKTEKPLFLIIAPRKSININGDLYAAFLYYNYGGASRIDIKKINNLASQMIHQNPYYINLLHKFSYQEIIESIKMEDIY